jgi:hypothetical protein
MATITKAAQRRIENAASASQRKFDPSTGIPEVKFCMVRTLLEKSRFAALYALATY